MEEKDLGGVDYVGQVERSSSSEDGETLQYDWEEERKIVRKVDWAVIPMLFAINMCSFLDRGNIGNAYTAGLGRSWGIDSGRYSWLVTIFFIGYICFQWLILAWKVFPPPMIAMISALGFGSLSILQAATSSFGGLLAVRFLLGVFEAAFAPGIPFYLSFFYNRREMGLRYGLFLSSAALASCFASALAYGILHADTSIAGWQLLFIIEGSPTIILAIVVGVVLPASPKSCRFLDAREKEILAKRAVKARGVDSGRKLNGKQVLAAFLDYKNYLSSVILFCLNTTYNALPAFLPAVIRDIGIGDTLTSQGLTAPPYLFAFIVCIAASKLSDRFGNRGYFLAAVSMMSAIGYTLLAIVDTPGVRYFATFLVCGGGFPAIALIFAWQTDNQGSDSKRGAGLVIFGTIGQAGSILGAHLLPASEAPKYVKGMSINAGILFFAAVLTLVLSGCMRLQNRARDRRFGKVSGDEMPEDIYEQGDGHPVYRYIL